MEEEDEMAKAEREKRQGQGRNGTWEEGRQAGKEGHHFIYCVSPGRNKDKTGKEPDGDFWRKTHTNSFSTRGSHRQSIALRFSHGLISARDNGSWVSKPMTGQVEGKGGS